MCVISLPLLQAEVTLVCKVSVPFKAGFSIVAFPAVSACFFLSALQGVVPLRIFLNVPLVLENVYWGLICGQSHIVFSVS